LSGVEEDMSNRIMLMIGVVAGVILVLAISAFAHRAREPGVGPATTVTERAAQVQGIRR
jgi:heme/copper-type cytochrome/quinol oxidase subunit 2